MLIKVLICLIISICSATASSSVKVPKYLAIYYGYPSLVENSRYDLTKATNWFKQFDLIVLGDGLWKPSHDDHLNTKTIIRNLIAHKKKVFGYIALGVNGTESPTLSETQMRTAVDGWLAMGVTVRLSLDSVSVMLYRCRVYSGMKLFTQAWFGTAMHNFDYFQATDIYYGSTNNQLPFRKNPSSRYGNVWKSAVIESNTAKSQFSRSTNSKTLIIEGDGATWGRGKFSR